MIDRDALIESFIEVRLKEPTDFLRIKETLTRVGLTGKYNDTLVQTCHILHKQGKYYIVHFAELFKLDGKPSQFEIEDELRRNRIADMLQEWGLCEIVEPDRFSEMVPLHRLKVISFDEKPNWKLRSVYKIGRKINNMEK